MSGSAGAMGSECPTEHSFGGREGSSDYFCPEVTYKRKRGGERQCPEK